MSLGEKIAQFGRTKFNTVGAFSEALGMSIQNLSQYLNDRAAPGTPMLKKLLKMGCDLNWLLSEDNNLLAMEKPEEYGKRLEKVYDVRREKEELIKYLEEFLIKLKE